MTDPRLERLAALLLDYALEGLEELLLEEGSEEQIEFLSYIEWSEVEAVDATVTVWGRANTRSFTRLDAQRNQKLVATQRKLKNAYWKHIEAGTKRWVGTQMPTHAHAQDAGMSLSEFAQFVFGACHVLEGEDAAAYWRSTSGLLTP